MSDQTKNKGESGRVDLPAECKQSFEKSSNNVSSNDTSMILEEKSIDNNNNNNNNDFGSNELPSHIRELLNAQGPIVKAVLLKQDGTSVEIDYDTTPKKMEAAKILGAQPTIVGEYHELEVIVVRGKYTKEDIDSNVNGIDCNKHELRWPFNKDKFYGDLFLYRVDNNGNAVNFTLNEYNIFYSNKKDDIKKEQEWEEQCKNNPSLNEPFSLASMFADNIKDDYSDNENEMNIDSNNNNNNENGINGISGIENDFDSLNDLNSNDMIGIEKLKEILESQIRKDFLKLHGSEPNEELMNQLIEQNIEAIMQLSDESDANDEYVPDDTMDAIDEVDEIDEIEDDGIEEEDKSQDNSNLNDKNEDNNSNNGDQSDADKDGNDDNVDRMSISLDAN